MTDLPCYRLCMALVTQAGALALALTTHIRCNSAPPPCAGNGVGALAPRGRGFAMWLCVTLASFYVNGQFFGLITRLAPMPLAGGGAGGDAGAAAPAGGAAAAGPAAQRGQQAQQALRAQQVQQAQQAQQPGFLMVGQQVHPAAAMAWAAAAAAQAAGAPDAAQQLADGVAELGAPAEPALQADAAVGPEEPEQAAEQAQQAQQADAGMQAGGPGAAEPPVPAPQQRRVMGGPRLPDRPGRRNAGVGPEPQAGAAAAGVGDRGAPPPQVRLALCWNLLSRQTRKFCKTARFAWLQA